jgi:hypothetical protein
MTSEGKDGPVTSGHDQETLVNRASQTRGERAVRAEEREGIRGRPREAGRLTKKLPSPALKEAESFGSYNPGALNTLTGGTVRHGTVQGHIAGRATRAALCDSAQT